MNNNVPKISANTIARLLVLAIALINQMLVMAGKVPIEIAEEVIYQVCTGVFTIGAAGWAAWKDNAITKGARAVEAVKHEIKAEAIGKAVIIEEEPYYEEEEVEFDQKLYEKNMEENGFRFENKITDGIGEER